MNDQALKIVPSVNRRVGRYSLLCHFATGGMANLYLARFVGPDGFEKRVAIKQIHEHLNEDEDFIKMFVDEARLAARISHPNVVQVLELGTDRDLHFMAMEYVNGETLTALVRRFRIPLPMCARIIADAAAGLHAAHELRDSGDESLGVVHRDVSPQNILISYDGAVKMADFGVARARSNLHVTQAGVVKGKYSYMAPEQVTDEPIDRRTDVFSLGIVLYEISTRHRLFKADSEVAIVAKVVHSDIVRPTQLMPDYPPTLEQIVMCALSRDPDHRFQTALEFQEALESYIIESGAPVLHSAIAQVMKRVFADRIQRKKELLTAAATDDEYIPEVEMGSDPSLTLEGRNDSVARFQVKLLQENSSRRRRRLVLAIGGGSLAVLLVVAAVLLLVFHDSEEDLPLTSTSAAGAAEGAAGGQREADEGGATAGATAGKAGAGDGKTDRSPGGPTSSSLTPRKVKVSVKARPDDAIITVDGKRYANPFEIEREERAGALSVKVQAPGYVPHDFEVDLREGGRWVIALERLAPDAGVKKRRRRRPRHGPRRGGLPRDDDDDDLFDNPYGR